ncbi:MAG: 23S rRNA (adenine(2503)-C(2))-methyltransferase RlmN [Planctomycetes bacterium]|nr:23S rRNA (adenine(2503)-C(2))-methyltransferase RlmN [Planctomycetota bacterium]MCC7169523.1 23S rRNA (adenine(2503)-C(2))-methyltransferase RlmN [Planctomycetota bacterium]
MTTDVSAPPLLAKTLRESQELAARVFARPEWVLRLRRLLLAGRDLEEVERETSRVWARFAPTMTVLETKVLQQHDTAADGATKLLVGLRDGNAVETVVLPSPRGVSVCLSTQVGCPVGCTFCASGAAGLKRNLDAHEIVEQVVHARRVRPDIDRLVVMGIGEPLLNSANLFRALDILIEESGIGPRRMIVSTVGTQNAIRRLGAYGRKVTLALSLHAPDDELRARLIPSMKGTRVAELMDDVDWYIKTTGRKAMAEYTLLKGVNDSQDHAIAVGQLLKGRETYLNVIPYNAVAGAPYEGVTRDEAMRFTALVRANGAFALVRKTMGGEEYAACGQLRAASWAKGEMPPKS